MVHHLHETASSNPRRKDLVYVVRVVDPWPIERDVLWKTYQPERLRPTVRLKCRKAVGMKMSVLEHLGVCKSLSLRPEHIRRSLPAKGFASTVNGHATNSLSGGRLNDLALPGGAGPEPLCV
jgi:hypothetical protein